MIDLSRMVADRAFLALVMVLTVSGGLPAIAKERPALPFQELGAYQGVPYEIIIPKNWNGGLVVDAHGYHHVSKGPFDFDEHESIRSHMNAAAARGYATARSAFSIPGMNWMEGAAESVALKAYFAERFGIKGRAIITGNHGGGVICHLVLERYPTAFDGGLCMSGAGGPLLARYFRDSFDRRLLFDHFFPGLPGSAAQPFDGELDEADIVRLLSLAPKEKVDAYLRMTDRWDFESVGRAVRSANNNLNDIIRIRLKGKNPFDNRNVIYFGSNDDATLNRTIARHAADPGAADFLRGWSMNGRIERPMIAMNALRDKIVSVSGRRYYLDLIQQEDREHLYTQLWIDQSGSAIPAPIFDKAFALLEAWIKTGRKPASGEIRGE